jgi:hypothetical protein
MPRLRFALAEAHELLLRTDAERSHGRGSTSQPDERTPLHVHP